VDRLSQRTRSSTTLAAIVAATAIIVAACSSSGGASPSAAAAASAVASAAASAAGEVYEVKAVQDAKLGSYLVGEDGKTLYVFTKDTGGKSVCNDKCAQSWPPFTLDAGEATKAGDGVTGTLATVKRDDGTTQVTYDGAPIYYFAKDTKAGDVTGQNVGGVWFVAAVAGGPGGASAAPAASAAAGGGTPAKIIDFGFDPASLSVKVGESVTWTNTGATAHTVTADDGSFDSKSMAAGATFSQTFAKAGTFAYHCAIHPGMKGTVTVS
jgi:predicted lipoprotein with Yx(FWY)xxD motif